MTPCVRKALGTGVASQAGSMRLPSALVAVVLVLGTAARAGAVATAGEICDPTDPCVIDRLFEVDDGAVLDFGDRAVEMENGGRLDVGRGTMTIMARSVRLRGNARLLGRGGRIVVNTTGNIELGSGTRIDVSETSNLNDVPGSLRLAAGGDVTINGLLNASAVQKNEGGAVEIAGNAVTIGTGGRIDVTGGGQSGGGIVVLTAQGHLAIDGPIDAPGGDSGGSIEIDALSVSTSARLDVSGGPNGAGAVVDIIARGPVVIGGVISGEVDPPGPVFGQAAEVSILTTGNVELNEAIMLTGGTPGGEGGLVDVNAEGDILQRGPIIVAGRGTSGVGGEVRLTSRGALTLADIDVAGATAGIIATLSVGGTRLTGSLGADSSLELFGTAGTVDVAACTLDMDTGAVLSTDGVGGMNRVRSGGQMVLRGTIRAGESNVIEYQDPAIPPVVSGTVTPPTSPIADPGLGLCVVPGTGTTTTTLPGNCGTLADFDGLLCRLAALTATINQAGDAALGGKRAAKKLRKKLGRATKLVEAARDGKPKKQAKKLRAAGRQMNGFLKLVARGQQKGKIDAALAGTLGGLGDAARVQIEQLRGTP